jgi:hypothetical protein
VNLDELVQNHFTWVFEPYRQQRMHGKTQGDETLVRETVRQVCARLLDLLEGRAGTSPVTAQPDILYTSPYNFVIADEHGDPNSRLVLASQGHTNLISLICTRPNGRRTYSIIRGSPFDEDIFQVSKLIEAFQAAEDRPDVKIWGGSNLAAGSDSELGSSLHWTELRDLAEPIVRAACRANLSGEPTPLSRPTLPGVLIVMPPGEQARLRECLTECGIDAYVVPSCAEARKVLNLEFQIGAVFSAVHMADGTYGTLLEMAREHTHPVPIVVCIREIDGGWIDLLEAGAFQVLPEPYDAAKVRKVLDTALALYRGGVVG